MRRKITIKKFKFRLDPLLRLRKMEENRVLQEFASVAARFNQYEAVKAESRRLVEEEVARTQNEKEKMRDINYYLMHQRYLARLDSEYETALANAEAMKEEMAAERKKVSEAASRRRVIELLKEKQFSEFKKELLKSERKNTEESNMLRFSAETTEEQKEYDYMEEWNRSLDEEGRRPEDLEEYSAEKEPDPLAEYFKQLGMDDPREIKKR